MLYISYLYIYMINQNRGVTMDADMNVLNHMDFVPITEDYNKVITHLPELH